MKRLKCASCLSLALLALSGCAPAPAPAASETAPLPPYGEALSARCQAFFEEEALTGLAIGLVDKGQVLYLNYGLAHAQGAPITENTLFEIASISKTFCGLLLAALCEEGVLSLEDAASGYVDFPLPVYGEAGAPIRLADLATHSAGLPRMPLNYRESLNPYADYDMEKLKSYFETNARLQSPPGEQYAYSNLGYGLLGLALTRAKGLDYDGSRGYESLLRQYIFQPLGMGDTALLLTEAQEAERARPHTALGTPCPNWDFDALAACGAIKSTTADMVKYMQAAMAGEGSPLEGAFRLALEERFSSPEARLGLGFFIRDYAGKRYYWHNGISGGYQSMFLFSPEEGKGIVLLCNHAVSVYELGWELLDFMG